MLSILIPTYNYDAFPLVSEIQRQAAKAGIPFEIICLDDASPQQETKNEEINTLENACYEILESNIGRSKIRNLLVKRAKYDWLLFLDADVMPKSANFIDSYIPFMDAVPKVVNGGIVYQSEKPEKQRLFRWLYGTKREALPFEKRNQNPYLSLLTLNFMIHRSVFEKVQFNEDIPNLRHEDTLFSYDLMLEKIPVLHIQNPVIHLGLDVFETAIRKENQSLVALKFLIDHHLLANDYLRISKLFATLKEKNMVGVFARLHKSTESAFLSNLSGNFPSLLVFDLYRIGYLCALEKN